MSIMKVPFLIEFINPLSPKTTCSTIVLVGKHKKIRDVCEATSEGFEQPIAPLFVKYFRLFSLGSYAYSWYFFSNLSASGFPILPSPIKPILSMK